MATPLNDWRRLRASLPRQAQSNDLSTEIAQFAARALAFDSPDDLLDDAVSVVAGVLGVPLVSMFTLVKGGEELFWAAGVGWAPGLVREMSVSSHEPSLCVVALDTEAVAQSPDFNDEPRFTINPVLAAHRAGSGLAVPLIMRGVPYGTLTIFDVKPRAFSAAEETALSLIGSIVASAVARSEADTALMKQLMRDPLTGLANRALFDDRTSRALLRAAPGSMVAVVLADIDAFKLVNDTYGHTTGDELLAALAPRLVAALPREATVARLGGDEFAVCLDGLADAATAHALAAKVSSTLSGRMEVTGQELFVSASVGVSVTGHRGVLPGDLLREADVAMYRAKELGRGRVEIYDHALRTRVVERLSLETELIRAAEAAEFTLAYQPLVHLATNQVQGFEALLRWPRTGGQPCSPAVFVPILEECGWINLVGQQVLLDAAREMIGWQRRFGPDLHLSVNASAHQLGRPELLKVVERVHEEGLQPGSLHIEVTETALLESTEDARASLQQLRDAGVRVVLDDFGTGYSSLSHLIDFPLDVIKIDRSFVAGLGTQRRQTTVTESVIELARRLSLRVVAEGVETEEQRRLVTELGCDYGQGHLWAPPMPADAVPGLLGDEVRAGSGLRPA